MITCKKASNGLIICLKCITFHHSLFIILRYIVVKMRLVVPPALMSSEEDSVAVIADVKSSVYRLHPRREAQTGDVFWGAVCKSQLPNYPVLITCNKNTTA